MTLKKSLFVALVAGSRSCADSEQLRTPSSVVMVAADRGGGGGSLGIARFVGWRRFMGRLMVAVHGAAWR